MGLRACADPSASEARPKAHGKHKNSKKPHWFFGRLESFSRSHSGETAHSSLRSLSPNAKNSSVTYVGVA